MIKKQAQKNLTDVIKFIEISDREKQALQTEIDKLKRKVKNLELDRSALRSDLDRLSRTK
jgi:septal ring factor EnvC (AmiA/AmiB activator)